MSYPPPYSGQYSDIYGSESPSTPHPHQPPGAFPQWETLEHTQPHDLHSLQSSHHSTPMQTPTSTSFRPIELEEPPHLVPSQAHLSHTGSPLDDAPVLLHHPHDVQQQQQQYQQQQYDYLAQHQLQQHRHPDYEQMQEMGPPDTSALFRTTQPPMGVLRSIPSSGIRAVGTHPYYRRTSGSALSTQRGHDSPGGSVEPATPIAVSPVPSFSGGGVATPVITTAPTPPPTTRTTTRRTRSAEKPRASVRFEAGTKTTSGLAPTPRATAARAGTPVPSASTSAGSTSTVPVLRSATRRTAPSARTPPPSQTTAASTTTASSSGSGSGATSSRARPILQSWATTSTSTPSTSLPQASTTPHAPPSVPPLTRTPGSSPRSRVPITSIPTDMYYSPKTHILSASLELPGVKREHIHVRMGTCYFNHVKYVVVVAESMPVFWGGAGGGGEEGIGVNEASTGAAGKPDVQTRREEEEEEEDSDSAMKTEMPEQATRMSPPTNTDPRSRSHSATSTAPSPLNMPPPTSIPSTSTSTSNTRADRSQLLSQYMIPKLHASETPSASDGTGMKTDGIGRIVSANLRERRFGIMRRLIQVPATTTLANVNASLEDGVLSLQIDFGPPYEIDDGVDIPVRWGGQEI
ncbi:hypothetical protein CVT25_001142 [Psilocybe cyanescens]|uniref:SHSP domain-containing protein n=1 Tax=Psilocybe cyanescens TaxID=93625 RepID=A0A409XBB6_PSICY|nr:hypothetical protein CVT25_001142 [Psilocybe cyanescens]